MGLRAVNNFLASTLPSSRKIGMAAAECLAQFFQPDAKLDFELEAGDELVAACRQLYRAAGDLLKRSDGGPTERSMQAMTLQAPQESRAQADSDDDDDEQDDDLTPYAMPHELPVDDLTDVGRAKRSNREPVYVGQCIELLKGAEDVENVDAVLTHIVEVVERASDLVLEECAQDLCRRLLYLENRFTLSFFSQRLLALVQLYMRLPRTIGPYLGEQFYARSCSVGQRIDILQAICAACLRLHPVHLKQTANLAPLQSAYDSISDETARSKTRWYSAKMRAGKEKPLPERNKLSGVAGWFFYPYLAPWENAIQKPNATSSEAGVAALVRSLQSEHCLVLEKLIIALSTVVYHAAHTPEHGQLAHDLWLFGWSLRHHTDRKVQTAVLFGFTCIFETVDEAAIKRDMPDYAFLLGDWIAETLKQDGNEKDAIAFMAFLMARLQTILSQELQLSLS
ncbi:TEL2, telomere maintenance protein 2 [Sorochytrium milnesiophthora]